MSTTIELLDEGVLINYVDASGASIGKLVDPEDFGLALARQTRLDTGLLPPNTRYYSRTDSREILVFELPPVIKTLTFTPAQQFQVPLPRLVFILDIAVNSTVKSLVNTFVFSLKLPLLEPATMLYRFPFGNVYGDGHICWGSVRIPPYKSLISFSAVSELMLSSVFNGDLDRDRYHAFTDEENNISVSTGARLMRYLNGKNDFPVDILVEENSFEELLRRVMYGHNNR